MDEKELKEKSEYNTTHKTCPMCQNYPLEYIISGGVKEVFCSHCDYYETTEI